VRVRAVLDQEDAVVAAVLSDPLGVEGDVAPMCTSHATRGLCCSAFRSKSSKRHAQVLAVAVHELDAPAGADHGERRGRERVDGHSTVWPRHAGELECGHRAARPAAERDRFESVPLAPGRLEAAA